MDTSACPAWRQGEGAFRLCRFQPVALHGPALVCALDSSICRPASPCQAEPHSCASRGGPSMLRLQVRARLGLPVAMPRIGLPPVSRPRIIAGSHGPAPQRAGRVAQLVEQGIENPRVGGSIPSPATICESIPRAPEGAFVVSGFASPGSGVGLFLHAMAPATDGARPASRSLCDGPGSARGKMPLHGCRLRFHGIAARAGAPPDGEGADAWFAS